LSIFGGSGALFEARSWEEVGRLLPTSNLYKPEVLGSLREVQKRRNADRIVKPKSFLCREAIEERNFAGHFWELRSTVFSVVSCVGFLRSRRTQPDQFVIHLTLF
jgi:hypothetical protein